MNTIIQGDCRQGMTAWPDGCVDCCITSPPYWGLRDYGIPPTEWPEVTFIPMAGLPALTVPPGRSPHGSEEDLWAYVGHEVAIFREVHRVLSRRGTLWLNLGDCYTSKNRKYYGPCGPGRITRAGIKKAPRQKQPRGLKEKDLCGLAWRIAFALQAEGWYLRQDLIWHKPSALPESVRDRCSRNHEYIFLLTKSSRYYYDNEAVKEPCRSGPSVVRKMLEKKDRIDFKCFHHDPGPLVAHRGRTNVGRRRSVGDPSGRNRRSVWTIPTQGTKEAHFAVFPPRLVEPMILAGCPPNGCVLDPFAGSGTVGAVAARLRRNYILIDMNPAYVQEIAVPRLTEAELGVPVAEQRAGQMSLFRGS